MKDFRKIFSIIFIAFGFAFTTVCAQVTPVSDRLDSLKNLIQQRQLSETEQVDVLLQLSWDLKSKQPQLALDYGKNALQLAEKLKWNEKIADALRHIGIVYWQFGNFNMAMDFLQESNILFQRQGDQMGTARTLSNIGLIFWEQGHYEKALENYFQALRLMEKLNDNSGIAPVLNNIGLVYQLQGDYELATDFHLRSLEIKLELNDEKGASFSYNNLGIVKQEMGEYENALEYYHQALRIREAFGDKREIAQTLNNIGYLYLLKDRTDVALINLNRALALYSEVDDKGGIAQTYYYLGLVYRDMRRLPQAEGFFTSSLQIAQQIGHSKIVSDNYKQLAGIMAAKRDFRGAYNYQERYLQIRDSLFTQESQQRVREMQLLYDRERKESEIELLRKTNQINALNLQKQHIIRNFLVAGVVLVLISLFLLYNRVLFVTKSNRQLEAQKEEISQSNQKLLYLNKTLLEQKQKVDELNQKLNETNMRLTESESHLIETNFTKDKFFSIISHDLRNPFASIVSFSRILKRDINNLGKDELQELAKELDKSVIKINNLLENLLQWSRAQTGKINYHPEYVLAKDLVHDNLNLFTASTREKQIQISDAVDSELVIYADRNMTNTVFRNLLSNALKYSDEGTSIEIKSQRKGKMAYFTVKDQGVGMTPEQIGSLWNVNTIRTTYGTHDEKGSGLGLLLCKEFVEKQGGYISVRSEKGKGSEFIFCLPIQPPD